MGRKVTVAWPFGLILIIFLLFSIMGCSNKLEKENETLKQKITQLEAEVKQLQETDQFYFNKGIDLINNAASTESKADYESASDVFKQLIQKFPASSYVNKANKNIRNAEKQIAIMTTIENSLQAIDDSVSNGKIAKGYAELSKLKRLIPKEKYIEMSQRLRAENDRIEEEKYRPKSDDDAVEEYEAFRRNEKEHVTTWRIQADSYESVGMNSHVHLFGYLCGNTNYRVEIEDTNGGMPLSNSGRLQPVRGDWLIVTGRLSYMNLDNHIEIVAYRIKNEGP